MALPGKNQPTDAAPKGGRVMMLDIGTVKPDPNQPRPSFEFDGPDLADLAASIKKHGVLQPITVEPGDGPAQFRVIMGERRLRAAKLAGLTQIPALLGKVLPANEREIQQIHENLQRKAFSTEALVAAVEKLLGTGMKQAQIAEAFNVGKELISRYATLAKAPALLRNLAKTVSARPLYALTKLYDREPEAVARFIEGTNPEDIDHGTVTALAASFDRAPPASKADQLEPESIVASADENGTSSVSETELEGNVLGSDSVAASGKDHPQKDDRGPAQPSPGSGNTRAVSSTKEDDAEGGPSSRRKPAIGFKLFFQVGENEMELDLASTALRQDGECVFFDALGEPVTAPSKDVRLVEVRSV